MAKGSRRSVFVVAALVVGFAAPAQAQEIVPAGGDITLVKSGLNGTVKRNIRAVARTWGQKVGFNEIFTNAVQATRAFDPLPGEVTGFRWEAGNEGESDWRPQGITGTADAYPSEVTRGRKVLITSWYRREPNPDHARITLHDTTAANEGAKYRHVLLVLPGARGNISLAQTHAGGLAWIGNYLYVASTDHLRVFDLRNIIKVKPSKRGDVLTYDYILPQSGSYVAPGNPNFGISSVSLDRSGGQLALVTSEFKRNASGGRIVRFALNKNGLMGSSRKAAAAFKAEGVVDIQGALMRNGRFALTSSYGKGNPSKLYTGARNTRLKVTTWARDGAEDLFLVPSSNRLYTLTEFEGSRRVFAVDAGSVGL
jgi:hypothetical protein